MTKMLCKKRKDIFLGKYSDGAVTFFDKPQRGLCGLSEVDRQPGRQAEYRPPMHH